MEGRAVVVLALVQKPKVRRQIDQVKLLEMPSEVQKDRSRPFKAIRSSKKERKLEFIVS